MKPTVRDVAHAAKVSIGTVSRVLNGDQNVAPDTADRVKDAIRSTNYSRLRQRSRPQNSPPDQPLAGRTIGLVLLGMSEALSTLPVVMAAVQGVEAAVTAAGGGLRLLNAPTAELPEAARREKFDGLIVKGALQGDLAAAVGPVIRSRLKEVPTVWVLGRPPGLPGDGVGANDWRAGQLAADHLLAHGHRRLAFLNPKPDHAAFRVRAAGFTDRAAQGRATVRMYLGHAAGGQPFPLPPVKDVDAVVPLLDALLADVPPPTALFVPADNIAALVYRAAAARGISIGQDLSIVSCNNERSLTASLYPALSTVDTHPEMVGRIAVERIARRLAGANGPVIDVQVDPELVPGESVGTITPPVA